MSPRRTLVGIFILLISSATILQAQLNRGIMEGLVTDPQGASAPDVNVAITNVDTGVSVPTRTNSAGYYRVVDLVPGKYHAHFEASGFSPVDVSDIEVLAAQVRRVDLELRLGATREVVQVTAEAPLVETAAANFSTSLERRTIEEMPLQGRDLQQLVYLMPGVNPVSGPPGSNFGFNSEFGTFPDPTHALGSDVSVHGGQGGANAWYLDGNVDLVAFSENAAVTPSPDAVSEFQTITNAFSAEYGRTGGGVFNMVLKSGSNTLHGNVYEFIRNDATNARNPFTSIDSLGHIIKQRQLRYNDFGGTLGGPVVLPHLYNGKDRTFFFFSWDSTILHLLGNKVFSVPTALMRTGNFSEDPNVPLYGIWNPYSTAGPADDGTFARSAFGTPIVPNGCSGQIVGPAGGTTTANPTSATCNFATQIPAMVSTPFGPRPGLDPVAMYFVNSFPMPNYLDPLSGCSLASGGTTRICDNFLGTVGTSQDSSNISLKIDEQWSAKSKYFFEWLFNPGKYNNYRVPWTGPTFPMDLVGATSNYPVAFANQVAGLGNTYTFSPTLINEFRASFGRQFLSTNPSHPYPDSITAQTAVEQELAPIKLPFDAFYQIPNWGVTGPGGSFIKFGPTSWVNMITTAESYNILDNVTKIIGHHTLKTGFMYRLEHTAYDSGFPLSLDFYGDEVKDPNTNLGASGLAQLMLGAVGTLGGFPESGAGVMWQPYERFRYWGFYGEDDFRITPNFTLNLGLRYDIFGLFSTRQQPGSNFCLGCPNSTTGLLGKVIYVGDPEWPGHGKAIATPNYNDIGPRVNFSWAPFGNRKTVIRGGYDIFYSNAFAGINEPGQGAANAPGWNQEYDWFGSYYPQCPPYLGVCTAFPLSDTTTTKGDLTAPLPLPSTFPAQSRAALIGASVVQGFTPPSHDPMVQMWSFEVQRELPGNMAVTVGYVGTHGTHLLGGGQDFNIVPTKKLLQYKDRIYTEVPVTQVYSGKTAQMLQQIYGSSELPLTLLLQPYPFYAAANGIDSGLGTFANYYGASIYHALDVRVQKRLSHGLNFIAAYTASKEIDNPWVGTTPRGLVDPIHFNLNGNTGGRAGEFSGQTGYGGQDPYNWKVDRAVATDDIPQMLNVAATYELPFGSGRRFLNQKGPVNKLLGGWLLSANFNAAKGVPLSVGCPGNEITSRCNLIGDPNFSGSRSRQQQIAQWLNPAAFEPPFGSDQSFWANYDPTDPRAWQFGTMGPRLPATRAPGFWNVDTALAKQFHLSESRYFEFRWEAFNALNHQNLGTPNTSFCLPPIFNSDGSETTDAVHQDGCSFGRITNIQTDPRSMEFALKFYW
jgi:hypothetical protein